MRKKTVTEIDGYEPMWVIEKRCSVRHAPNPAHGPKFQGVCKVRSGVTIADRGESPVKATAIAQVARNLALPKC